MSIQHPPNSRLVKYAKYSPETFSIPVSTKLTPTMNNDFLRLCQELNLTPAEAIRYLIEEELKEWKTVWKRQERETAATKEPNRNQTAPNQQATNPLKVNGQMPCPLCKTWHVNIAAHLKKAHKTNKQEVFSTPEYIEIAKEMAEQMTRDTCGTWQT